LLRPIAMWIIFKKACFTQPREIESCVALKSHRENRELDSAQSYRSRSACRTVSLRKYILDDSTMRFWRSLPQNRSVPHTTMEEHDCVPLDRAVEDGRRVAATDEIFDAYCSRLVTAEAALFVFLVTRAVVGLATAPDGAGVVQAATPTRGEGSDSGRHGRARARAAFALVLPAHASSRDATLWTRTDGAERDVRVSANLARAVRATLHDVCIAAPHAALHELPDRLADMWTHAKRTSPRLSVKALRYAVGEWARGPEDGALAFEHAKTHSETSDSETRSEASETPSETRPKRRRVECVSVSAEPETPARRARSRRRRPRAHPPPTISTVAELLRAYAATYVGRRHACGYEIVVSKRSTTTADTAFRFDEFFAVQCVSTVLRSEPWQRLVKGVDMPADDAFLCVELDEELGRDVDALIHSHSRTHALARSSHPPPHSHRTPRAGTRRGNRSFRPCHRTPAPGQHACTCFHRRARAHARTQKSTAPSCCWSDTAPASIAVFLDTVQKLIDLGNHDGAVTMPGVVMRHMNGERVVCDGKCPTLIVTQGGPCPTPATDAPRISHWITLRSIWPCLVRTWRYVLR